MDSAFLFLALCLFAHETLDGISANVLKKAKSVGFNRFPVLWSSFRYKTNLFRICIVILQLTSFLSLMWILLEGDRLIYSCLVVILFTIPWVLENKLAIHARHRLNHSYGSKSWRSLYRFSWLSAGFRIAFAILIVLIVLPIE